MAGEKTILISPNPKKSWIYEWFNNSYEFPKKPLCKKHKFDMSTLSIDETVGMDKDYKIQGVIKTEIYRYCLKCDRWISIYNSEN
jgi:hypothetical protein